MNALKDMNSRWKTYQKVDSSETLLEDTDKSAFLHKESEYDSESRADAILRSYRKLIALLASAVLILVVCAFALLLALVFKKPTDKQCGIQTTVWCK
jgi:hypothetical protein